MVSFASLHFNLKSVFMNRLKACFLCFVIALAACAPKKETGVSIAVTVTGKSDSITFDLRNRDLQLGYEKTDVMASVVTDTSGTARFNVTVDAPGNYVITSDGLKSLMLYLQPGLDISISLDEKDKTIAPQFSGNGAIYQEAIYKLRTDLKIFNVMDMMRLEPEVLDSMLLASTAQGDELAEKLKPSFTEIPEFDQMLKAWVVSQKAEVFERYPDYYQYFNGKNPAYIPDSTGQRWVEFLSYADVGLKIQGYRNNVSTYLDYLTTKKRDEMIESGVHKDSITYEKYQAMKFEIASGVEHVGLRELMMATDIMTRMNFMELTNIESQLVDFKTAYPTSIYVAPLDKFHAKTENLKPGKPAIEFTGLTMEGEKKSIKDYVGKVVYVDVWATWCGPCRAEFPHAKTLKEEFKDNKDVVFMYVSIDDGQKEWKAYLEKDPEFKGEHLYAEGAWNSDICNEYLISGIPRYMLIDKQGNISTADAPRPSSGEKIRESINALLAAEPNS